VSSRNDLVDEAHLERFLCRDLFARQHHVECRLHSDESRQPLRAAGARKQAELRLGKAELGLAAIACDAGMTSEGRLEAAAERDPVNRRDHGLREVLDAVHHLVAFVARALAVGFGLDGLEHRDVGARDEAVLLAGGEDDRLDVRVVFDLVEHRRERVDEVRLERVHRLTGDVHANDGYAVVALLDRESFVRHHSASNTMAAPKPPAAQAVQRAKLPPRRLSSRRVCVI
jgi:hypothetical protein